MDETKRIPMQTITCSKTAAGISKGKVIYLRREGSDRRGGDHFKITSTVGEGGSCVCYEATLLNEKKTGRLKEFYPLYGSAENTPFSLVRTKRNHLVSAEDTKDAFLAARAEFVQSYHLLRDAMAKHSKNNEFTSFIPDFSIYYACDENGDFMENSTCYIWTAPQNLTVFEKYIQDIHKYPGAHPEHKLFTILKTALTLTECIRIFHENGLLHLDIKPGNFGIPQRKRELLTDSISMFDVNTIYSLRSSFPVSCGTEGFSAPELARGRADNTSDIYSIGCTLFCALIVNDEIETMGYAKKYYPQIPQLINTSKLIKASETNANIFLKHRLSEILKKCLAELPGKRYQSCTELANDLKQALVYLYPAELNAKLSPTKQLVILDKELDKKRGPGIGLTLLYHLYRHPLFEATPRESDSMDVLIVGFGNYGQQFLDCCLQAGQIYGKKLNVTIISNEREDKAVVKDMYLKERPELSKFFSIDGLCVENAYGSISFVTRELANGTGSLQKNKAAAEEIARENEKARYIFIALGDDRLNRNVAQALTEAVKDRIDCSVNFAFDGDPISGKVYGNPVYMSSDFTGDPEYLEIERMAFNGHLLWMSGLNEDIAKAWKEFKAPYNYLSSISNAVAVKYKLYSVGLTMDNLDAAAAAYAEIIAQDPLRRNEIIALEHQRWNCEKICAGYIPLRDLKFCISGPTKDEKAKFHVCLVRSRAESPLQEKDTGANAWDHGRWDTAGKEDLAGLDELDRVSVELHQIYLRHANQMRKDVSLFDDTMNRLKMIANKNVSSGIAFSEWFSALSLLWSGIDTAVREYAPLRDNLKDSLKNLEHDDRETAAALVEIIDKRFALILKSMKYTDWKNIDATLIDGIPFILTHRRNIHLAIPFSTGTNTQIFKNVAVPTIVNPAQVTYIHHFSGEDDLADFWTAIKYIFHYLPEKHISAKLNFVLSYTKGSLPEEKMAEVKNKLAENVSTRRVILLPSADEFDIAQNIERTLGDKLHADAIEQNTTPLSYLLIGAGIYRSHPKYCFDISSKTFYDVEDCDYLKYIKAKQYLKVSDMFASKNAKGVIDSPMAFSRDYNRLWRKAYRGQEGIWKKLCRLLSKYHEADTIVTVNFDLLRDKGTIEKYRYLLPSAAFADAKKLIDFMVAANIFEKDSAVYYYTPDSCEVTIFASELLKEKIHTLFADVNLFTQPERMLLKKTPYSVSVSHDFLRVCDFDLKSAGKHADRIKQLLELLADEFAFISGLSESSADSQLLSFSYSTKRIKRLLTNEGNILEVYIYLRCLKSGLFDDVTTGYEIAWDGTPITSEFDVIVTKGFSGLLIEAKATEEIRQEYYFKLSSLANQFGTNCKAVLVADTIERYFSANTENNTMQRQRGNMLDIHTVFDTRDIDNIETALAKLLNVSLPQTQASAAPTKPLNRPVPPKQTKPSAPTPVSPNEPKSAPLPPKEPKSNAPTPVSPNEPKSAPLPPKEPKSNAPTPISAESKIWLLRQYGHLEHSQVSILTNHGIATIGQFLQQTEEDLENIRSSKGICFKSKYMEVQHKLKKILGMA